jgi:nucleotide-binding universal stress UspA family protein
MPVVDEEVTALKREHEAAYLAELQQRLGRSPAIKVETVLLDGPIAPTLARDAMANRASLIVMTTHGHGGFERLWLGSVVDTLIRTSPVPLLVLRFADEAAPAAAPQVRRILVPLDGSLLAEEAIPHALDLGALSGAEYVLVHVTEPSAWLGRLPGGTLAASPAAEGGQKRERQAEDYLTRVAGRLAERGFKAETRVVVSSHLARAILETAQASHADLIALATHGRGGLSRLLIGSVADKVLRRSDVPLLLCHPQPA